MPLSITEVFGYSPADVSEAASNQRASEKCPFTDRVCWKAFRRGDAVNGTCTVKPPKSDEVVICPQRLYAEDYRILRDVAEMAFGKNAVLLRASQLPGTQGRQSRVVAFGKDWGGELRVPRSSKQLGDYAVDWILAEVDRDGQLTEFVPVEVQTVDTTGSYQPEWYRLFGHALPPGKIGKASNLNWENVNKRIIPQLLSKGNVFRRESLCRKGLFFVCPQPVFERLAGRLGTSLSEFPFGSGALTFCPYHLAAPGTQPGTIRALESNGRFTTTVENLRDAFNSTLELPPMGAMAEAIRRALRQARPPRS